MLAPDPDSRPVALTIAGSDSGGGAGIQADLAAMAGQGAYGTSVITAVTAQHTRGVEGSFPLSAEEVRAQFEAVREDFAVGAAKTGMLATASVVEAVADRAGDVSFPLVVDPVMVATSGDRLLEPAAERAYEDLVAEAALVTPNVAEAEVLTGRAVEDVADAVAAGEDLLETGADAALVTGGHLPSEGVSDVLVDADGSHVLEHSRIDTDATHGSGCALSAAITARLAAGDDLRTAVEDGVDFLSRAVRYHYDVGEGPGAVNHGVSLRNTAARADVGDVVRRLAEEASGTDAEPDLAGSTPYAEDADDIAVHDDGRVRFGARTAAAGALLAARQQRPDLRFVAVVGTADRALDRPATGSDDGLPRDLPSGSPIVVEEDDQTVLLAANARDLRRAVRELDER